MSAEHCSRGNATLAAIILNLLAGSGLLWIAAPVHSQTISTWRGGAGNWAPCPPDGNALWDTCPTYPDGNFSAVIEGGPVTLASGNGITIVNLSLASGDSLIITPGYLDITGSSILNNGSISIGSGDGLFIQAPAKVTLSGSGSVTMTSPSTRFWGGNGTGATLINEQTIQGQGSLGVEGLAITNQGVINANAGTLNVQPPSAINTGTMEASSGSTLAFTNGAAIPYNNAGGVIKALDGGTVQLDDGVYTGGTLTTVGSGVIQANNSAVLNSLSNTGTLQISAATLEGTITNTGKIEVPSAATLSMSGNVTLTGAGSVLMIGSGSLRQLDSTDTLTNHQLIHGSGTIYELPLTNEGTISADRKSNTLTLAGGTITNQATMKASGGGTLQLETVVDNTGGIIEALAGSTVILVNDFNGSVNGGTLTTSGTGTIQSQNGVLDGTINVPTNAGLLEVNNFDLFLQGTINNTGTIALTGNSCVILNQPATLTGSGKLTMGSSSCIFGAGLAFSNQSTIQGAGSIGDSNPMPITNAGTILANQASPLLIVPNAAGFTNSGKLIVNARSKLDIDGPFNNLTTVGTLSGGTYIVTGALGFQNPVVTNNASITLNGAAAEIVNGSTNALTSLAAIGAEGALTLLSGQALTTTASLSNAGKITIGSGSSLKVGGALTQTSGLATVDGTLTASLGLMLREGSIMGQGTLEAALTSDSTVTAGDSTGKAGKLTVTGNYTEKPTGILNVAIGGATVGTQYSQLAISDEASLNGTLNIKLINKFVPKIGDTFNILSAHAVNGKFSTVNGLGINLSEHFEIRYTTADVSLIVVSGA